jgi:hypothetical protein
VAACPSLLTSSALCAGQEIEAAQLTARGTSKLAIDRIQAEMRLSPPCRRPHLPERMVREIDAYCPEVYSGTAHARDAQRRAAWAREIHFPEDGHLAEPNFIARWMVYAILSLMFGDEADLRVLWFVRRAVGTTVQ